VYTMAMIYKETFVRKGTNTTAIVAGATIAINYQTEAEKNNNLPHNSLAMANLSTNNTLFIFLDEKINENTPDYVLYPQQNLSINVEEGLHFHTVFVINKGAVDEAINELKYRVGTAKIEPTTRL